MHKEYGYTLLELTIIIVIIGILAVYPLIKWPGTTVNVLAEAQVVASDIRYAQTLSMSTATCYRLVRTSPTTYSVTNGSSNILLPSGSTSMTLNSDLTFGTWSPTNLIAFNSNGTPFSDTCVTQLNTNATIPITNGINTNTITVSPLTGMVSVS